MDRSGEIFDGRYRLQRRLGQGGMAEVYAARDEKLAKAVAVKVLAGECAALPRITRRFEQEARAASRIRHDNVVDVTDVGRAPDGAAYLVMELLRGEDLAATLAREGALPWSRVGAIALQICAALAAAHRAGVVHRDIKPSNCFRLAGGDIIKVLDFGIARVDDPDGRVGEPTTAGTVLGTPEYIAPEVAAGEPAGPRSDLYAVGALLYKLLTGSAPFTGNSFHAVLSKQIFEPPVPLRRRAPDREIPPVVEALVLRALAKDPAQRQPDMAALAAEIAAVLGQTDSIVPGPPSLNHFRKEGEAPVEPTPPPAASTSSLVGASADASTDSLAVLPVEPRLHEPVTAPDPLRTVRRGATLRLAAVPRPPRRSLRIGLGAAAAAVAGVLLGVRLTLPDPEDMPEAAGAADQARSDMPVGPAAQGQPSVVDSARADMPVGPAARGQPSVVDPARADMPVGPAAQSQPAVVDPDAARADMPVGPAAPVVDGSDPARPAASEQPPGDNPADSIEPRDPGAAGSKDAAADPNAGNAHVSPDIPQETPVSASRTGDARRVNRTRPRPEPVEAAPAFDAAAAARALDARAAAVRGCALDADMMRGELQLRIGVDAGGRVTVDAAPGARAVDPAALACIRRALGKIRLAPTAGELVHAFHL